MCDNQEQCSLTSKPKKKQYGQSRHKLYNMRSTQTEQNNNEFCNKNEQQWADSSSLSRHAYYEVACTIETHAVRYRLRHAYEYGRVCQCMRSVSTSTHYSQFLISLRISNLNNCATMIGTLISFRWTSVSCNAIDTIAYYTVAYTGQYISCVDRRRNNNNNNKFVKRHKVVTSEAHLFTTQVVGLQYCNLFHTKPSAA